MINENDTVATSEIRFGDNDRLAARVAAMMNADALVLLSDIDGLYSADPRIDPDARFIPEVAGDHAGDRGHGRRSPARLFLGRHGHQADRRQDRDRRRLPHGDPGRPRGTHPLLALENGARCTWFLADLEPLTARKRWIAGALQPRGRISIDSGALAALRNGRSLLPAGVTVIEGRFERGDAVTVLAPDGGEIARGLSAYSEPDAQRIKGHKSGEIEARLGYRGREELIHRDDLVLI